MLRVSPVNGEKRSQYIQFRRIPYALLLATTRALLFQSRLTLAAQNPSQNTPKLDFDALGSLAVAGLFDGIELYNPSTSYIPSVSSSNTSLGFSTLLTLDQAGQVSRLATVPGQIYALAQCGTDELYFGGSFLSVNGNNQATNIAVYNLRNGSITSLKGGLDGPVATLACDEGTDTLYAGGRFIGPIGDESFGFTGSVATWDTKTRTWNPLPFAGFPGNGSVRSIAFTNTSDETRSVLFGGDFVAYWLNASASNVTVSAFNNTVSITSCNSTTSASANGSISVFPSYGSSLLPIALSTASISSSASSTNALFADPTSILCPVGNDGAENSTWLAEDGTTGRITVREFTPLEVGGFRLGNTQVGGSGTETFR